LLHSLVIYLSLISEDIHFHIYYTKHNLLPLFLFPSQSILFGYFSGKIASPKGFHYYYRNSFFCSILKSLSAGLTIYITETSQFNLTFQISYTSKNYPPCNLLDKCFSCPCIFIYTIKISNIFFFGKIYGNYFRGRRKLNTRYSLSL